jgi:hypothetical protein
MKNYTVTFYVMKIYCVDTTKLINGLFLRDIVH